jgi:hypothetical protein
LGPITRISHFYKYFKISKSAKLKTNMAPTISDNEYSASRTFYAKASIQVDSLGSWDTDVPTAH